MRKGSNRSVRPCGICAQPVDRKPAKVWNHPHFKSVHPEYCAWFQAWMRNFMIVAILLVASLVLSDYLWLEYGLWYVAAFATLFFFVFVHYELLWVWWRKNRWFVSEWKKQHSSTSPII